MIVESGLTDFQLRGHACRALILFGVFIELNSKVEA